jgi:hypothetical protein
MTHATATRKQTLPLMTGKELVRLMRFHHVTIRELKRRSGFTLKRIRVRREIGLETLNQVRDWVQSISGRDPGNVGRWFAIALTMNRVLGDRSLGKRNEC